MKRKPNNGAGPEPREAAGAADPGGAGEGSAGGTSGQSVPKSKFRQKSNQEKAAASKLRMEKRGEKLDRAKEKLAKQKPPKKAGPGEACGPGGQRLRPQLLCMGRFTKNEHENVGIEGAHRSELVGESALRHGSRFVKRKIREHPAKAVRKASPNISRLRQITIFTPPHRSTRSSPKTLCPGFGRSGGSARGIRSRQRRRPNTGPRPPGKRLLPQKSWRPGRWVL